MSKFSSLLLGISSFVFVILSTTVRSQSDDETTTLKVLTQTQPIKYVARKRTLDMMRNAVRAYCAIDMGNLPAEPGDVTLTMTFDEQPISVVNATMTEVDRFVFKNTERVTGEELSFRVTVVYPNGMKPPVGKCISEINRERSTV